MTIRALFGFMGLRFNSCVALWKACNSEANQKKRLQFRREHKDCLLCAESRLDLFVSDPQQGKNRVRANDYTSHRVQVQVQAYGGMFMIWAWLFHISVQQHNMYKEKLGHLST